MSWPVSDGTKGEQQSEFIAGQRVCFFWPHDGAAAAVIHCTWSLGSIRNSLHACTPEPLNWKFLKHKSFNPKISLEARLYMKRVSFLVAHMTLLLPVFSLERWRDDVSSNPSVSRLGCASVLSPRSCNRRPTMENNAVSPLAGIGFGSTTGNRYHGIW